MKIFYCIALCMIGNFSANAEELADNAQRMSVSTGDSRQLVNFPPEVKAHALANMRGHLKALADTMDAFARKKYAEAADIADKQLGMGSQGAIGCQMKDMGMMPMSDTAHLDHQMSLLMPEKMRELGQNMHRAANEFAAKARDADKDNKNAASAAIALARIPQQCVACHASYRMQ